MNLWGIAIELFSQYFVAFKTENFTKNSTVMRYFFVIKPALLWLTVGLLMTTSCDKRQTQASKSSNFVNYISAHTTGAIGSRELVRVVLAEPSTEFSATNKALDDNVLTFEPEIKGQTIWLDSRTLLFTPENPLPSGTFYQANLALNALFRSVPDSLQSFVFNFSVIEQSFVPMALKLSTYTNKDLNWYRLAGELNSADVAEIEEVESKLNVALSGKAFGVKWRQAPDRKVHYFVIDSVPRGEKAAELKLNWAEDVLFSENDAKIEVPALGDFKVLAVQLITTPEPVLRINFSDPLDEKQNLNGLITVEDAKNLQLNISNTQVEVLFPNPVYGERLLQVFAGIKNVAGYALSGKYEESITFEDVKPAVAFTGSGNIIPQSTGLTLPFRAVNLRAVDVYVLKIFSNNVPQFLQVNQLEGDYQLKRVGRPVAYKRIDLAGAAANLKIWNTYSLDLAELVKPEPGAIYRVEFKFNKSYSLYECNGAENETDNLADLDNVQELNTDEYDQPDSYYWDDYYDYYEYDEDYDYRQRDNPCNSAYYSSRRMESRNLLATNLALTVKGGENGAFHAFVTNLKTTETVANAQVSFYNYQNQLMGKATTNGAGEASVSIDGKPFLAVVQQGSQMAYLRIDDGSALSLANFDVGGSVVQKGLKGFIYAERGVWRPGDTVHTQFMLEDALATLPNNHPVIFEVRNPEGKMVDRQVKTSNKQGIYNFYFATEQQAPTGFYSALVRVGGVSFSKSLRIETIKPNRLKVALTFDEEVLESPSAQANLHANWLTGASAGNLKADVSMQLRSKNLQAKNFAGYNFNDATRDFYSQEKTVFTGNLDAQGNAQPKIELGNYRYAPGMLEAVFITRVFEPGGDASFDRQAVDFAPFKAFAGLKVDKPKNAPWLQTDEPIVVQVASINGAGEPQNRNLNVQVYSMDWSWWWSSARNGLGNYLNSTYARKIYSTSVQTKSGKGSFNFTVKYPNWGNYLVRVCDEESGHCASQVVYIDWPMSRNRGNRANPGAPSMLTFSADKDTYNGGDVAKLLIPTAQSGRLLISLETGSQVLKHFWVDAKAGQTQVEIPITDEMTPTVYAFVSYIQPHAQSANDLPIRLYGVIPLAVNNEKTRLKPEIIAPEEWQPEQTATVSVKEANGKAMAYTLAIVDEGLLDITRFKTPDPWSQFYAREALGVKTWDYFDDVMGAYGGAIQKNFAIGGDQEFDPTGKKRLNRFTPVVKVLGPFTLEAGKTATHSFLMPNYVGSVRVMVVARQAEKYGNAERVVPVRKPLMVLATLPRVAGPGEKITLPVQVFAMKPEVKNVNIVLKTNNLLRAGENTQRMVFSEVGDKMAYFDLTVAEQTGKAIVDVTVTSGKEKATYQVALDVRNPNMRENRKQAFVLAKGEKKMVTLDDFGIPGSQNLTIDASSIPNLNISEAANYLLGYPHGCVEQTVSKAFPQLFLPKLVQLADGQKQVAKENVQYAINKLQNFQQANGAFSLWPSGQYVHNWASTYATHFLVEAKNAGFGVPEGLLNRSLSYQSNVANSWQVAFSNHSHYQYLEQAYRLYVLALGGKGDIGAMNRLRNGTLTKDVAWRLAAAYAVLGQVEAAKSLMAKQYYVPTGYYYDPTFGNQLRAAAMYLETYLLVNDKAKAFEQAKVLVDEMNNAQLYSSQSTAFSLYALNKFLATRSNGALKFNVKVDGAETSISQGATLYSKQFLGNKKQVVVENLSEDEIYISLVKSGIPMPGQEQSNKNELQVTVRYKTLAGDALDVSELKQGTDFKAVVSISSTADSYKLYDMALTQIFPSGWEIINTRLLDIDDAAANSSYTYRDYRDDRVYTYFGMTPRAIKTFEVRLNAAYLGKYYLPDAVVEAMYYPTVISRGTGSWISVVP